MNGTILIEPSSALKSKQYQHPHEDIEIQTLEQAK